MAKRILMRLGKSPFDPLSPTQTLRTNSIGGNNGNLVFGLAAHKLLSANDNDVVPNRYRVSGDMAAQISDEYDLVVFPFANMFRPSFKNELIKTTEFIEKLKIPFVMLSGGAQIETDGDYSALSGIEDEVKRFSRAVLRHSSSLTVRGELTAKYLRHLGFSDVEVVGCPSMTMNGPGHAVVKSDVLSADARIAYNIETSKELFPDFFEDIENRFDATYFPQDRRTLGMMLWGMNPYSGMDPRLPFSLNHPQFWQGKAEYHIDAPHWIERMSTMDFSIGPRIHGNIAPILSGTPSMVLAHDMRTVELAQYHEIPYIDVRRLEKLPLVEELYEQTDFSGFNQGHRSRFEVLQNFLHKNGVETIFDDGQEAFRKDYEERLTKIPRMGPLVRPGLRESLEAVGVLHESQTKQSGINVDLKKRAQTTSAEVDSLRVEIARLKDELGQVTQRVKKIETRKPLVTRVHRKIRRTLKGK